jgi:hypothetical protein
MSATWQKDLLDHLLADAAVAAALGATAGTGSGWNLTPPAGSALPYFVLREITDKRGLTHGGSDNTAAGRVQVDCFAETLAGAMAIREAIIDVLHGFRGAMGATYFGRIEHNTGLSFFESLVDRTRAATEFELQRYLAPIAT